MLIAFWLLAVFSVAFTGKRVAAQSRKFPDPDLVPSLLWTSATVNATSTSYHFLAVVRNQGGLPSGVTQTRLRVDLWKNGSWDIELFRTTGWLNPGGSESEFWAFAATVPNSPPSGSHLFQICVDALNSEAEGKEENNCRRKVF